MKKAIILFLLLILTIVSVAAHAEDTDLREYFYTMIYRPLSPRPYITTELGEYRIDLSELFWLAINDLVNTTEDSKHWIGIFDPHSIYRPKYISDSDREFIEQWYGDNGFYLTYDMIKDLEDISREYIDATMIDDSSYDEILSDILCSRLVRRKASGVTENNKASTDKMTAAYFDKNLKELKRLFSGGDDINRSLVYSVALRGKLKLFILIICVLTDGAITYNPNSCIIDRSTLYAIEDWCWINEHKIPYSIINEILSAYYKDIIRRVVLLYDDYDNFSDLLNDCEGITAVKKKIVELHLTDIRSFLTSQP